MLPRRYWLTLLSALAVLLTPFALAPRATEAQGNAYLVDTLSDAAGFTCATRTLADSDCSLRQALTLARNDGGASTITFFAALYGGTITLEDPNNPLPTLSDNGTSINAFAGQPRIGINGNGSSFNGLTISGSNNSVTGLSLYGFICSANGAGGVVLEGSSVTGNVVEGNYIGVDLAGTAPSANQRNCNGVVIRGGAANNTIRNNVVSANAGDGILIQNASDNAVTGNRIGLATTGDTVLGNGQNGVNLFSLAGQTTQRNRVGGTAFNEQNVIAGSGSGSSSFAGIRVHGTGTLTSTISSNFIGTDSIGSVDRGNLGDGILVIAGARGTQIQGTGAAPVVISGNDGNGIRVTGAGTSGTTISGVYVGVNGAGGTTSPVYPSAAIPNSLDGIRIDSGAANTTVTGTTVNRTVIAGNTRSGVTVDGTATTGNRVENSLIGVIVAGTTSAPQPNAQGGLLVNNARTTAVAGNTVSGNAAFGIRLTSALSTTITGNFVGLSLDRKAVQGNAGPGVDVQTSRNTLIGGGSGATNYLAGNAGPAVSIAGSGTLSTTVRGNLIGLVQEPGASTNYLGRGPNGGEGVRIASGARSVTVDGNTIGAAADTTANDFPAVLVQGDNTTGPQGGLSATNVATVTLVSNRIGWLPQSLGSSTLVPFPNSDGIAVSGRVQAVNILTNSIRLNVGAAIRLTDVLTVTARGNQIQRNDAAGIVVAGTSRNLLIERNAVFESGRNNTVVTNPAADGIFFNAGGTITGAQILSNTIRSNTGRGVALQGDVNRATMRFNLLALNGGPIRLVGSTIFNGTPPDPDSQTTPNHGIDPPIVDLNFARPLALRVNDAGVVEGYVYTSTVRTESGLNPVSACITCTIQLFRPDRTVPAENQGGELLFALPEGGTATPRDTIPVAASGRFSARLLDTLPDRLLLVATDGFGNSSEYATMPITASVVLEPTSPLAREAAPGETVTYTLRLRNTGTLGFTRLRLATSGTLARWALTTAPFTNTDIVLPANSSRLITATLTLPTGSDPNVAAGKKDVTTLTISTGGPPAVSVSARLETTVLPRPVISVVPRSSLGSGRPGTPVPHAFTIGNSGNVTVTLDLDYFTRDPAVSPGRWVTTISTRTVTLAPGASTRIGLSVTVPTGAVQNTAATTAITATVRPGTSPTFPGQTIAFSATTRAELSPNADLYPDLEAEGGAGGVVPFTHTVENKSNGTARFCLDYFSASGSTVRFESATSGFVVDGQGCFTLYANADVNPSQGRFAIAQIRALVTVQRALTTGDLETVTIFLRQGSPTGESISDATVEDKIRVNRGIKIDRLWLPLVRR